MRSRTCRSSRLAGVLVLAALLAAAPAAAQPKAELDRAKQAYQDGASAYQLGKFEEAARRFEEAYRITKFATMLFDIAQCYRRLYETTKDLDMLKKAVEIYQAYLREAPAKAAKRRTAEGLVPQLQQTLAQESQRRKLELVARATGREGLAVAERLLGEGAPKDAAAILERLLAARGNPRDLIAGALAKRGLALARLGQGAAAVEAFKRALALDPGFLPPEGDAPVAAAFAAAKKFWEGKRPLTVTHVPPGDVAAGKAARVVVTIESDPLALVTELVVHYRQAGQGAYSIGRGPASASVVEVPAAFLAGLKGGTRVEYYIEALDGLEGELVALGSPREPFVFAVAGAPLGETAPGPGPSGSAWYKKWWVWTVAGAVVAGAATGAYFGTRTAPYNPPGVHVPMP